MAKNQKPWRQYTRGHWPAWLKAVLLKWWAAGAVLFFVGWGLPWNLNAIDLAVLLGVVMGVFTDLILNNILRVFAHGQGECDPYMMWGQGGVKSLVLNVLHSVLVMVLVVATYNIINAAIISLAGLEPTAVPFGVEPVFFGVIFLGYDMLLLLIKRRIKKLLSRG